MKWLRIIPFVIALVVFVHALTTAIERFGVGPPLILIALALVGTILMWLILGTNQGPRKESGNPNNSSR